MTEDRHPPRRHRDGQRQRLAEDQGGGRGAGRVRRALRGPRDERPPHAGSGGRVRRRRRARGLKVLIAAAGRRGPPGRRGRRAHDAAGHRPARAHPELGGLDSLLSTVQMPGDVPVASGGRGHGRAAQRRPVGRPDPGPGRPGYANGWPNSNANWPRKSRPRTRRYNND